MRHSWLRKHMRRSLNKQSALQNITTQTMVALVIVVFTRISMRRDSPLAFVMSEHTIRMGSLKIKIKNLP
jgi:hypothetical protein